MTDATDLPQPTEEQRAALQEAALADAIQDAPKPIRTDDSPFAGWLRVQAHRKDRVGALARVALVDPTWPQGQDRAGITRYFQKQGARQFVLETVKQAWDEFDQQQRRERNRAKSRAAKAARKKNRAAGSRKR